MKWTPGQTSGDIEDRRGMRASGGGGFGGSGMKIGGGLGLVIVLLGLFFGRNWLGGGGGGGSGASGGAPGATQEIDPADEPLVQFVSFVLDDAQNTWTQIFAKEGLQYQRAKLVLFTGEVDSGCGFASAQIGPFYCPRDAKVYIDLGFFRDLRERFGAGGDFAQAYVLAHELGHHVQHLTDVARVSGREDNETSVRVELQADCLAGVWAHSTQQRDILERGDVEEGLAAAAAIGDDTLQKRAGTRVSPESFTHGSSAQRVRWFRRGLSSGTIASCDTFSARDL